MHFPSVFSVTSVVQRRFSGFIFPDSFRSFWIGKPSSCALCDSRYGAGMFGLTRNEQALVAGFVFIFLLGFGVRQWRESAAFRAVPTAAP